MDPGVSGICCANQRLTTVAEPHLNSRSTVAKKIQNISYKMKMFDSRLICMDVEHCNHSSS